MNLVFICSPYSGDVTNNVEFAKNICRNVLQYENVIPFAPHLYFTQFLDDNVQKERTQGMNAGQIMLRKCAAIWVYADKGVSKGMQQEIEWASKNDIPIVFKQFNTLPFNNAESK